MCAFCDCVGRQGWGLAADERARGRGQRARPGGVSETRPWRLWAVDPWLFGLHCTCTAPWLRCCRASLSRWIPNVGLTVSEPSAASTAAQRISSSTRGRRRRRRRAAHRQSCTQRSAVRSALPSAVDTSLRTIASLLGRIGGFSSVAPSYLGPCATGGCRLRRLFPLISWRH